MIIILMTMMALYKYLLFIIITVEEWNSSFSDGKLVDRFTNVLAPAF